jgi:hypothetical protein
VFSQDKLKLSVHLLDTAFANVWTEKGAGWKYLGPIDKVQRIETLDAWEVMKRGFIFLFLLCPGVYFFTYVRLSVRRPNGFRSITEEHLGLETLKLVWWLVVTSTWPLLILLSMGQRSRSHWPCR